MRRPLPFVRCFQRVLKPILVILECLKLSRDPTEMINRYDIVQVSHRLLFGYRHSILVLIVMTLGLGLSLYLFAQTFTITKATLPFEEPESIVLLARSENGVSRVTGGLFDYDVHFVSSAQSSFDDFGAFEERTFTLSDGSFAEQVLGVAASPALFSLARVDAFLGRTLLDSDINDGAEEAVVLGYEIWISLFGGDKGIVGKTIFVDREPRVVVGVMPPSFRLPSNHNVWISYVPQKEAAPTGAGWHSFFGRLKPGVTIAQAQDAMEQLAGQLRRDYPEIYGDKTISVRNYVAPFGDALKLPITIMKLVAIAVLAMSWFGVTNLMLVRSAEASKECAIKTVLGVPPSKVSITLIIESLVLCAIGGVLGSALCFLLIKLAGHSVTSGPFWWVLEFDSNTTMIAVGYVVIIWLSSIVAPLAMAYRLPSNQLISGGSKGGASSRTGTVVLFFISFQILAAFVLVVFTGLSLFALARVSNADYGVSTENYLTASVRLSEKAYPNLADRVQFYHQLEGELLGRSGIEGVSFTSGLPGSYSYLSTYGSVGGVDTQASINKALELPSSGNLFEMLKVPFIEGETFSTADDEESASVAVINIGMAQKLWPGSTAVGKSFQLNPDRKGPIVRVVGVVPNIIYGSPIALIKERFDLIYRPMTQVIPSWSRMQVLAKTVEQPYLSVSALESAGMAVDPQVAIADVLSFRDRLSKNEGEFQKLVRNFLPASILALFISAVAIYGITKRIVLQQCADIGVMKAFGTTDFVIATVYISRIMKYALIGLALGALFFMMGLPKISQHVVVANYVDTLGLAVVTSAVLLTVILVSAYFPLRRISKMAPIEAINSGRLREG